MKEVRTIIWDLDETVWFYEEDETKILCKKMKITQEERFKVEYYKMWDNLLPYFKDVIVTRDKVMKYIEEQMPILKVFNISSSDFMQTLREEKRNMVRVNEDAIKMMKYLKEKGLKNISITDYFTADQEIALKEINALIYIEKVYGCDNVYFKNSIGRVSQVIEELKIEKRREEFVMIGDSISSDIFFARKLGIKSIWFNRKGKINKTSNIPTMEISSLLELKNIF